MKGETEYAGLLVERFAGYHRQSYGGCKVGVGDVLIGASALAAQSNVVEKSSHIKDKLIEMTHLNETLYSCLLYTSLPSETPDTALTFSSGIYIFSESRILLHHS